ncbi:MAG: hypothetical protein HW405_722 [Candidatus Berkelbacteria bacterium]|nr:hypothetical protein [Candidatus Berkelbacteria bacterium]
MRKQILVNVGVLIVLIFLGIIISQHYTPKTYKYIVPSTDDQYFSFKYPPQYLIDNPVTGVIQVFEGKKLNDDYSNVVLDIEIVTTASDISVYENVTKVAKEQNTDPDLIKFIPGYTNKNIGSHAVYFLKDQNQNPDRLIGVLFENDKSLTLSYNSNKITSAEELIKNISL